MNNDRSKVFREYYHALVDIKKVFEDVTAKNSVVEGNLVREYESFLGQAGQDLPGVLVPFNAQDYFSHQNGARSTYYRGDGIRAHISRNLGKLKVGVDDVLQSPVIENKSFHFVSNEQIRKILERDYQEIQRGLITGNWKSTILLSGGSIEAILLDCLGKNSAEALASSKAPTETDLNKWHLNDLIEVSVQEKIVDSNIANLSHSVREYRNLIHPGVEIRKSLKVEPEEAKIALEVLNMLIRELS